VDTAPRSNFFLILGCQRSGTTLLRLILDSHPAVHCFDESLGYEHFQSGWHAERVPAGTHYIGHKIPVWTEYIADPRVPHPLNYRGEPILFLLRDVREVVASMFGMKDDWVAKQIPIRLEAACKAGIPQARVLWQEAQQALGSPWELTVAATVYWKMKTLAYFDLLAANLPVLAVNYRQLVCQPDAMLRRITHFLTIPWHDALLGHSMHAHDELEGQMAVGDTDSQRPIDRTSLDRWPERLTREQERVILDSAGRLNEAIQGLGRADAASSAARAYGRSCPAPGDVGPAPTAFRSRMARWGRRSLDIWETEGAWAAARRALRKVVRQFNPPWHARETAPAPTDSAATRRPKGTF